MMITDRSGQPIESTERIADAEGHCNVTALGNDNIMFLLIIVLCY